MTFHIEFVQSKSAKEITKGVWIFLEDRNEIAVNDSFIICWFEFLLLTKAHRYLMWKMK